jgi:MFS family permease
MTTIPARQLRQGLAANWPQFTLQMWLVFCVGLTVGTERTVLPLIGTDVFHLRSLTYIASFVVSFGAVKAVLNLVGGRLAERFGRRPPLIAGWLIAIPIPLLVIFAPSWNWVIAANVLLGINQGLAWSMSVNAKIDLVGPVRRGLAVGLDEAGGYGGVAVAALVTGYLGAAFGLRPAPFWFALGVILVALGLSWLLVQETLPYARLEAPTRSDDGRTFVELFALASVRDRTMFAVCQAGLIEKFVDALVWVVYPLYLASRGLPVEQIGTVVFVYGIVWGIGQIGAGQLADRIGRKPPIAAGMVLCGLGVLAVPLVQGWGWWLLAAGVTGAGMALLYPNLVTAAADAAQPSWRATGLGVYRFWRDGGYAIGGLFLGFLAAGGGLRASYFGVAAAMLISAAVLIAAMRETRPRPEAG